MARAVEVPTGTTDVAVISKATLHGYSARESSGTPAVATVIIRNGTTSSDPAVAYVELAANDSQTVTLPPIACPNGIYLDRVSGECEVILYIA